MSNSGAVLIESSYHLVCSRSGPFQVYCGAAVPDCRELLNYPPYKSEFCLACVEMDAADDAAKLVAETKRIKALPDAELVDKAMSFASDAGIGSDNPKEYHESCELAKVCRDELVRRLGVKA